MKVLLKILVLAALFFGLTIGSFWLIFSQDIILGILISLLLLVTCVGILAFSLYGIQVGQLARIGLKTRMQVATLLILTVYLSSALGLFAVVNTFLEFRNLSEIYTVGEKTEMLIPPLWNSGTKPDVAGSTEKNGVIYSYTDSTKDEIDKIDAFLEAEKGRIDEFFGNEEAGDLTIVFHDNFDTLSDASGYEEAMGYYEYRSQEIHLVPDDYSWNLILLHEYSHHQSHLYAQENRLSANRLPLWFEEGVADYLAGETSGWYELEGVEIIDFTSLNHDYSFHNSYTQTFDPYIQSFLAVESLADKYGEDQLKRFFSAELPAEFYGLLEETTGMELADFQETFLDDMIKESNDKIAQFDAAYEAMDMGLYTAAATIIDQLKPSASKEDLRHLSWMQTNLFLMQEQFEEAILFMENRLETGDPAYRIDDLTNLAELYLLVDSEKSLELIQEVEILLDENLSMDFAYYDLEVYLEAYELVNSDSPLEGYTILLDENLLYNEPIIERVKEKIESGFSEAR
ncbi:gluzincin family metallopeptidase [Metaplanococcus flavidus]|uniref:DUF1570 domain-containing protein n=1 Tax=Metaplanococcus flavidus TaxID=569883 RepID=A0ABW3LDA6_9BACL